MKKIFVIACAAFASVTLFAVPKCGVLVELDGRPGKISYTELNSPGLNASLQPQKPGNGENYFLIGEEELTGEWKSFTVSFVPSAKTLIFGFRATTNTPVEYDDIKLENGTAYNPSFELINDDNEIDGWRYYTPDTLRAGAKDAAEGEAFAVCSSAYGIRQGFNLKPGKKVTISFKARAGKTLAPPAVKNWASKNIRKMR